MKMINKISVKTCGVDAKENIGAPVLRVIGIARDVQTGETDKGPWTKLKGQFRGINLITGEEFVSGACFLPETATGMIVGQLADGDTESVEFGFDIHTVADASSATGYVYQVEPLVEVAESDPLEQLTAKISGDKALPSPKAKAKAKAKK